MIRGEATRRGEGSPETGSAQAGYVGLKQVHGSACRYTVTLPTAEFRGLDV